MIRQTWFSTNTVHCSAVPYLSFIWECIEIDNQYGRPMISDREIALLSNQLVCFFIAIIVKGFQGPSVFLDS